MSKKYLKALNFDEAKTFIFQNATLKSWIDESKWDTTKLNGTKLIKIQEKNATIGEKVMKDMNLNDAQMSYF